VIAAKSQRVATINLSVSSACASAVEPQVDKLQVNGSRPVPQIGIRQSTQRVLDKRIAQRLERLPIQPLLESDDLQRRDHAHRARPDSVWPAVCIGDKERGKVA
jgi:hypothetical protein